LQRRLFVGREHDVDDGGRGDGLVPGVPHLPSESRRELPDRWGWHPGLVHTRIIDAGRDASFGPGI
jgi:hypothetical protein